MGDINIAAPQAGITLSDGQARAVKQTQPRDSLVVTRLRLGLSGPPISVPPSTAQLAKPGVEHAVPLPDAASHAHKACGARFGARSKFPGMVPHHVTMAQQVPMPQILDAFENPKPSRRWGLALGRVLRAPSLHLSSLQRAAAVHQWLKAKELFEVSQSKPKHKLRAFYREDPATSTVLAQAGADIQIGLPWLDKKDVRALRKMLIGRARAEACAPALVQPILLEALQRFFQLHMTAARLRKPVLQTMRVPDAAGDIAILHSLHIGPIRFELSVPNSASPCGAWFVGVAPNGAPLAVKLFFKAAAKRQASSALEAAKRGDYLACHETDKHLYVVVPLFGSTLHDMAAHLFSGAVIDEASPAKLRYQEARRLFAEVIGAMHHYHRARRHAHGHINAASFFVDAAQKKFVLADAQNRRDAGLQTPLCQTAILPQRSAAEQMAGIPASRQSDTFDACQMFVSLWLMHDPEVHSVWLTLHRQTAVPADLLAGNNLGFAQKIFRVWSESRPGERDAAIAKSASLSHIPVATKHMCITRFNAVDVVLRRIDPVLWCLLQRGLQGRTIKEDATGPRTIGLQGETATWTSDGWQGTPASWHTIEPYSQALQTSLERLRGQRLSQD